MLALVFSCWAHGGHTHSPPPPAPVESTALPGWVEKEGPWTAGSYVDIAVGSGATHAIWLEGASLKYAKLGGRVEQVATNVDFGEGGQMRPEIVVGADGIPVIAYAGAEHVWMATREGGWVAHQIDHAKTGERGLMAFVLDAGVPTAVWLDSRAAGDKHAAAIWAGNIRMGGEVYAGDADGVCMCCKPALAVRGDDLWLAFRDADGPKREIRAMSFNSTGWTDRGEVTHGGWSPGGCPSDGPVIGPDAIYASDARDGKRRIWKVDGTGEHALPLLDPAHEAVQPRVVADGSVVTWVEVGGSDSTLVMLEGATAMPVVRRTGKLEPGDPVVVGQELWIPYEGDHARIIAQLPPGR